MPREMHVGPGGARATGAVVRAPKIHEIQPIQSANQISHLVGVLKHSTAHQLWGECDKA